MPPICGSRVTNPPPVAKLLRPDSMPATTTQTDHDYPGRRFVQGGGYVVSATGLGQSPLVLIGEWESRQSLEELLEPADEVDHGDSEYAADLAEFE
jgi:hypothetical protein